jgi:hypothetical protein
MSQPLDYKDVKINCGSVKKPDWWVMVGPENRFTVDYSAAYPNDEIEAAVDSDGAVSDDFTAERCDECGRIDGAHTQECSKSNALSFDDYLAYSKAHYKSNHNSHARKMELTKLNDEQVREWKQQQQGSGLELVRKCNHPSGCENEARPGFGYCEEHRAASVEQAIEEGKKATAKAKKPKAAKLSPVEAAIDR